MGVQSDRKVWNLLYNAEYLKQRIKLGIASLSPAMLKNIGSSVNFRLQKSFYFRGQYFEEII
jgi:hypothetical protein